MSAYKRLPEIYQVEVTTACQLECPLCHRQDTVRERGGNHHLDPLQLNEWIKRGDFGGSYFVELQMSGEPMLHPDLPLVAELLRGAGVMVGMSTNGLLMKERPEFIRGLDAITVSVDSMRPSRYARMRPYDASKNDGILQELLENIDALLANPHCPDFVDLQIVKPLDMSEEDADAELSAMKERFPDSRVTVRAIWDSTAVRLGRAKFEVQQELCINPWTSVSVQSDGTVVSCCMEWGRTPENVYGNLNSQSLDHIWNEGEAVQAMRARMRKGDAGGLCSTCYNKSPYLIHVGFMPTFVRRRRRLEVLQ